MDSDEMEFESEGEEQMKLTAEAKEAWQKRQYFQCLKIISEQCFESSDFDTDLAQWIIENNRLACKLKMAVDMNNVSKIENALHTLLGQIKGISTSFLICLLDTLVTFNIISAILIRRLCFSHAESSIFQAVKEIEQYLSECLKRICEFLGCVKFDIEKQDSIYIMFEEILDKVKSKGCPNDLTLIAFCITFTITVLFLLNGNSSKAKFILQKFTSLFPDQVFFLPNTVKPSEVDFEVFMNDDSKSVEFSKTLLGLKEVYLSMLKQFSLIVDFASVDYIACLENLEIVDIRSTNEDILYMKAFILFKQQRIGECLELCSKMKERVRMSSVRRWYTLLGSCIDKEGKGHTAIQLFSQALDHGGDSLLPLYNMSLVYRKLVIPDAEIECLNLLVDQISNSEYNSNTDIRPGGFRNFSLFGSEVIQRSGFNSFEIYMPQVLFVLAKRCLELGRYEEAVLNYEKLVDFLRKGTVLESWLSYPTDIHLPTLSVILRELCYCLLQTGNHQKCIEICNELLDAGILQNKEETSRTVRRISGQNVHERISGLTHSLGNTEKQDDGRFKRKINEQNEVWEAESVQNITVMFVKADALANLGKYEESLSSLNEVINVAQAYLCQQASAKTGEEKLPKLPKMNLEGPDVEPSKVTTVEDKVKSMLIDAYINKASILVIVDNLPHALDMSRLAVQLDSKSEVALYNHALILLKAGRWKEACQAWLPTRGITPDPLTLPETIHIQSVQLEELKLERGDIKCNTFEVLNEIEKVNFDVYLLKLLQEKTKSV